VSLGDDFAANGWVVVRGLIPPDEVVALRRLFLELVPEVCYPRRHDGVVWEVTGAARHVPPLAHVAHDRRCAAAVAEALACARVQLLQDSLLYKPPRDGGGVEWHQDHTYVGFLVPPRVVSLRVALFPEDAAAGCLRVVDGSHRWGPIGDVRALRERQVDSLVPSLSPEQAEALAGARGLELEPGDASIHHCLTLHGSGPNRADRPRKTVILRMFDADCRLDRSRLPAGAEEHFPTDADGRLDADRFPVVFGG
jgi:ectoine hydroxylase-related dioxygenase (phytanoyl-CoA dioxygenase family)